jgi:6-phosphogluconolactonase
MRFEPVADAEAAAARGAELIAEAASEAIASRGEFALAVSGGHAPWRMFELLGGQEPDWSRWSIFQVDERVAPVDDPDRNLAHLRASLPEAAAGAIRPMPVEADDLDAAAAAYAAELPEALDLVHLGLGPDGHTASLVPGDAVLEVDDRRVAPTAGEYQGRRRMTLTYPALRAARQTLWLVTGAEKREALAKLRECDPSIPAGRLVRAEDTVVCERAALGEVTAH